METIELGKPGRGFKMNVTITPHEKIGQIVTYNCPKCNGKNVHAWFGRELHYCDHCEEVTDIKGATVAS